MGIRIWYQSMAPLAGLSGYVDTLRRHAKQACGEGVEVVFNGASEEPYRGHMPTDILKYPYVKHVLQTEAIAFCRQAECDGFDAVVLGSFSEPFLAEIRSLLEIPVISMPESVLLVACSLAEQFALVSLTPASVRRVQALVRRHGIESRVCAIQSLTKPVNESDLDAAFAAPQAIVADFTAVAEQAVGAGADVVIPAEGVLNEVLYANGVRNVLGATVMDCVGAALLYAELQIKLKRRLGMGVGRRWAYAKPPAELLDQLKRMH